MAKTTNNNNDIVTGTIVVYNDTLYVVGEVYEDSCILRRTGERDIMIFKEDCIPV